MGIDLLTDNLQNVCAVLNELVLPRAIVDFKSRTFLAWNPKFLEQAGFSEDPLLIETAKIELEAVGLPQAESVARASDILTETTEKIALVIEEAGQNPK